MAQVGTIKELSGVVQAVGADGGARVLVLGDAINEGEVIVTVGADSSVKIGFENGRELLIVVSIRFDIITFFPIFIIILIRV